MRLSLLVLLCALAAGAMAAYRPVVIWHGMGDNCCNPRSMGAIKAEIQSQLPGTYVVSVMIGSNPDEDTVAGFLGNMNEQVATICEQLMNDPNITSAPAGINLVGFSQGGQLLRGLLQRCTGLDVASLITWGGQHTGVSDFPGCEFPGNASTICNIALGLFNEGVYAPYVRSHLIQAQYAVTPLDYAKFLEYNEYLVDINNLGPTPNATYKARIESLEHLVLIQFENDTIVVPRASEWFGQFVNGSLTEIESMFETQLYQQDLIGLRELYESNRLSFFATPGEHMQFTLDTFNTLCTFPYLSQEV
eukprot:c25246_g1_i1.p1 GENE.c25246_g1_i1~~c25246_g1_i1.p1  ORF type:complete len:305 (-),score=56.41 c25246_g1_i1:24-938(-)